MKEYKVLTAQGNEIVPHVLEGTLNAYAAQGWRVVNSFSVFAIGGISSITTVLERDAV